MADGSVIRPVDVTRTSAKLNEVHVGLQRCEGLLTKARAQLARLESHLYPAEEEAA